MKYRNSSLEFLKIFSLFIICISHCFMSNGIDYNVSSSNIYVIIGMFCRCCGQIGNMFFVVSSAYFLLDSKVAKSDKIIQIIVDTFLISILILVPFILFNNSVSFNDVVKQFFPISFKNNWFINCYLLLYCIHPFLNKIICNLNYTKHFRICLIMFLLFSCIQFVLDGAFFFNEFIGFIEIYFIVAFVKKYMNSFRSNVNLNILLLIISLLFNGILLLATNYFGLKYPSFSELVLKWNYNIANPFYIFLGLAVFNLFLKFEFHNRFINYVSSLSLIFYLIHENYLFRKYLRPKFFQIVNTDFSMLIWTLFISALVFITGMMLSMLYKELIQKHISKFVLFTKNSFLKIYRYYENKFLDYLCK